MEANSELTLVLHFNEEWKKEKVKLSPDFNETKKNILKIFDIEQEDCSSYVLKLPSGGLVEQNEVIFDMDTLCIIPKDMSEEPTGYTPMDEVDTKFKEEQMKDLNLNPKDKETFKNFHITKVTKADYDFLECLLLTKQYTNHHALTEVINKKWALPLGFSMKLLRPPKINKDKSQTWRLYWMRFNKVGKKENGKENIPKSTEAGEEEENCKFGITFKQDSETKIWLLYQEFDQVNFIHNHKCLERPKNLELNLREFDIEEYRRNNQDKVKSFATLQKLISHKNDLTGYQKAAVEIDLKNERVLKAKQDLTRSKESKFLDKQKKDKLKIERKDEVKSEKDTSSQKEISELIDLLQKKNQEVQGFLKIESVNHDDWNKKTAKLFYSNEDMKEVYNKFRDFIYIHRRVTETRFKKILTLIMGIDHNGLNRIYGISLTEKDDSLSNEWIFKNFSNFMGKAKPKAIMIERNKIVHKALTTVYHDQDISIVYCPYYIHKSLKFEFENDLRENNESLYEKIISIPLIESQTQFENYLWDVKDYAIKTNNDRHRNLILKLDSEKKLWATWYQKHLFFGGTVIWDRIAKIKGYLKISFAKYSSVSIADAFNQLLAIDKIDLKGALECRSISVKHNQIFMNFRMIKSLWDGDRVSNFIKERIKWYASKSFKFAITAQDEDNKIYLVQKKQELGGTSKSKLFGDDVKVVWIGNSLFCTWLEQFSTGIPCGHEFAVHMKHPEYDVRLNKRWFNEYQEGNFSIDEANAYFKLQQKLRSNIISYMKNLKSECIQITEADFSFKSGKSSNASAQDIIKLISEADSYFNISVREAPIKKDLNQEQLVKLIKKLDVNYIDLDELEELVNIESEDTHDTTDSIGKDQSVESISSSQYKRQMQLNIKRKVDKLNEMIKDAKLRKRDLKDFDKKHSETAENSENEVKKSTIQEMVLEMSPISKLNFIYLLYIKYWYFK